MAIYEKQISKRLENFLDDHTRWYDDGDAENGPHVASELDIPDWADDLVTVVMDPGFYMFTVYMANIDPEF